MEQSIPNKQTGHDKWSKVSKTIGAFSPFPKQMRTDCQQISNHKPMQYFRPYNNLVILTFFINLFSNFLNIGNDAILFVFLHLSKHFQRNWGYCVTLYTVISSTVESSKFHMEQSIPDKWSKVSQSNKQDMTNGAKCPKQMDKWSKLSQTNKVKYLRQMEQSNPDKLSKVSNGAYYPIPITNEDRLLADWLF